MIYNVATLLKSPMGTTQDVTLNPDEMPSMEADGVRFAGPITGTARLHRTSQGIWVDGTVTAPVRLQCSRCLREFAQTFTVNLHEQFYPTIDIETGKPLQVSENTESYFPIDAHHQMDLSEAVRQNLLVTLPLAPLHRPDCKGLCPVCGIDLNDAPDHRHAEEAGDERFAALRKLLEEK